MAEALTVTSCSSAPPSGAAVAAGAGAGAAASAASIESRCAIAGPAASSTAAIKYAAADLILYIPMTTNLPWCVALPIPGAISSYLWREHGRPPLSLGHNERSEEHTSELQ